MNRYFTEEAIEQWLREGANPSKERVREILAKGAEGRGLEPEEASVLLHLEDEELQGELLEKASALKEKIYGKRTVVFAPLYLTNECVNECLYCGFRCSNRELERQTLTLDQIREEAGALAGQGYRRLLLVCGEHPQKSRVEYITSAIAAIYENPDIRRVGVNAAPMEVEGFRALKEAGIGVYQLFQETYHRPTYKAMHPRGLKADYHWRVTAFERAIEGGVDDLGMGVLFGLYDYRYELLALFAHAQFLEKTYGFGPHTVSIPRLRPALGAKIQETPYLVGDEDLLKIVAVVRLALPYTGIVLTTREPQELRERMINLGVSQISAGSSTAPGGYSSKAKQAHQFAIDDDRSLEQMIEVLCEAGNIPSFCTACYRSGRTGSAFMDLSKPGNIKELCHPNALLTFAEYAVHHGTEAIKERAREIVAKEVAAISREPLRRETAARLERVWGGEKDLYF